MKRREFDKYNIEDYVFYAGRNKYDDEFSFVKDKTRPILEDTTNKELVGNVFMSRQDSLGSPSEHIKVINVFDLNGVLNGNLYNLHKIADREKFDYELRSGLMNQLWSRVQYEILIGNLGDNDQVKVDVYNQIMLNGFHFEKYCGEHKKLFKKFKSSYDMVEENSKCGRSKK